MLSFMRRPLIVAASRSLTTAVRQSTNNSSRSRFWLSSLTGGAVAFSISSSVYAYSPELIGLPTPEALEEAEQELRRLKHENVVLKARVHNLTMMQIKRQPTKLVDRVYNEDMQALR
mmetsp:Transcript_16988/g.30779  ORF Transcript_16988/g.30779 Transcript_16988/m.30779 type:complete len:117 (+) Transcript_16988:39-389(+)